MPDGYNTHIEQGGSNVSGGQKQRLCIARALLKKPKEIPNTTKLIIAQRISSVEHADRVIVMNEGRIDAFDTPENLLKNNEIYREVYESQTQGGGDFDEKAGEE